MTPREWGAVLADIYILWPDQKEWPELTEQRLYHDLRQFNPAAVARAVDRFVAAGEKYRPSPAQIESKVAEITADDLRYTNQLPEHPSMTKRQRQEVAEYAASVRGEQTWAEWLRHG